MDSAEHDTVRASRMPKRQARSTGCAQDINAGNPDKSRKHRLQSNSIAARDESAKHEFDYRRRESVNPSLLSAILPD
jgi:hypothetical protein